MIRVAKVSDAGELRALMKSVAGFWDDAWREDVLERALESAETIALVHLDRERIDGFVCAHDLGFRAYLSELIVSPSAQGQGIGGRLLSEAERLVLQRGCTTLISDVWKDAEPFYRSHGWTSPSVVLLRKRLADNAVVPSDLA